MFTWPQPRTQRINPGLSRCAPVRRWWLHVGEQRRAEIGRNFSKSAGQVKQIAEGIAVTGALPLNVFSTLLSEHEREKLRQQRHISFKKIEVYLYRGGCDLRA